MAVAIFADGIGPTGITPLKVFPGNPAYGNNTAVALDLWPDGLSVGIAAAVAGVRLASTINQTTHLSVFPLIQLFSDVHTHKSDADTTLTLDVSFYSAPTILNATASAVTCQAVGLYFNPTLSNTSVGTLTASVLYGVQVIGTIGTGTTTTVFAGLQVTDPNVAAGSPAPVVTTQVGVDLAALSKGANIYGMRSLIAAGANNYFLRDEGGAQNYLTGKFTRYNAITTAGFGVPAIVAAGRSAAATAAVASVASYTVGASDGTFRVSANVLVTTATTHSFTVTCAYTDEGNTARTATMTFFLVAGTALTNTVANGNGAVPYHGIPIHIRAKAATAITIATTGTFTTVTYNVEGVIQQLA